MKYNIFLAGASATVAISVAVIQIAGLLEKRFYPEGEEGGGEGKATAAEPFFWRAVKAINDNFGVVGVGIVAIFSASLAIARCKEKREKSREFQKDNAKEALVKEMQDEMLEKERKLKDKLSKIATGRIKIQAVDI